MITEQEGFKEQYFFTNILLPGKWMYMATGTGWENKNPSLVLTPKFLSAIGLTFYVSFHEFLWWKWQEVSKPLSVLLTKEEKQYLKKFAVQEAKSLIVKNSIQS